MADFPSYKTLELTGAIQPTFVPSDVSAIDKIEFYLERSGYGTELRKFFQKIEQTFSLPEVVVGTWTLTAIGASGSSAVEGASATVIVSAGQTFAVAMASPATGYTAPSGSTLLNRGNSYALIG
ncbi:hypothetical protein KAR91_47360, partial [Candidatus Pacearchaeota archaeon]|nr:hypothetical protein [Candidatus Pacearchaeota archaeon]